MAIDLSVILPNVAKTLDGTGFIFGSGTSCEAGYPMMPAMTREVMGGLVSTERTILAEVFTAAGESYNDTTATPNIEQICDLVIAHWTNSNDPRFSQLEMRLRALILRCILAIDNPTLDNHCRFFEALKKRCFCSRPCCVWIITTNYDLLFEIAAARTDVLLENGFCGTTERFFNPTHFGNSHGVVSGGRFSPSNNLVVEAAQVARVYFMG